MNRFNIGKSRLKQHKLKLVSNFLRKEIKSQDEKLCRRITADHIRLYKKMQLNHNEEKFLINLT